MALKERIADCYRLRYDMGQRALDMSKECPTALKNAMPKLIFKEGTWLENQQELQDQSLAIKMQYEGYEAEHQQRMASTLSAHATVLANAMGRKINELLHEFPETSRATVNKVCHDAGMKAFTKERTEKTHQTK